MSEGPDDKLPIIGYHRGVGLQDGQSPARLALVKGEIDAVIGMRDLVELAEYAGDIRHSPEARLFAGKKAEAILGGVHEGRQKRPKGLSVELVKARTVGLDSKAWRDPFSYCSLLCTRRPPGEPGAARRETPLRR